MDTAIVTGAAGFIGSHLAEKLLEEKIKVIGIDCFTDYYSKKIKENNISHLLKNENFTFIEQDLKNLDLLPIFQKSSYLFHLAAQPGVRASWGKTFQTYVQENILVTQKILEFAKMTGSFKKIVLASSSSVYGNQSGLMSEDTTVLKPLSPYGVTKLASENLGTVYAENFGLPVNSLRFFTVYGPRQRPDMAFNNFIKNGLSNKKIKIFGDGEQSRDFTFISDIVDANLLASKSEISGEIFNVGGGHIVTINHVLKELSNLLNKELDIQYVESQPGDVKHTSADISKAKSKLDYAPKIQIAEGLRKEVDYMKNNLNLYVD